MKMWWAALAIRIKTTKASMDPRSPLAALIRLFISKIEFLTFFISCMCVLPGPVTVIGPTPQPMVVVTHIPATIKATNTEKHTQPMQMFLINITI